MSRFKCVTHSTPGKYASLLYTTDKKAQSAKAIRWHWYLLVDDKFAGSGQVECCCSKGT